MCWLLNNVAMLIIGFYGVESTEKKPQIIGITFFLTLYNIDNQLFTKFNCCKIIGRIAFLVDLLLTHYLHSVAPKNYLLLESTLILWVLLASSQAVWKVSWVRLAIAG